MNSAGNEKPEEGIPRGRRFHIRRCLDLSRAHSEFGKVPPKRKEDYELREEIYKRHLECYGENHPETHDAKFALRMAKIFLSEYGGIQDPYRRLGLVPHPRVIGADSSAKPVPVSGAGE